MHPDCYKYRECCNYQPTEQKDKYKIIKRHKITGKIYEVNVKSDVELVKNIDATFKYTEELSIVAILNIE